MTSFCLGRQAETTEFVQNFIGLQSNLLIKFFPHGCDEFFVGRAGYLAACLVLNRRFQKAIIPSEVTLPICNEIIESGKQYSANHSHRCPLMYGYYKTEYLGKFFYHFSQDVLLFNVLKDKFGVDQIIFKKQPCQLLNTSCELFPSFDASNLHKFVNESSSVRPNILAILYFVLPFKATSKEGYFFSIQQ